jgi:tripartite-type tricarboxylate transporter receptor subunit TctC
LSELTGRRKSDRVRLVRARFDLTKFDYLATVGAPPSIWLVAPDSRITSVQQALDTKMRWSWAATGSTASMAIGAAFACEALKMDCLVVPGYNSGAQAALALTRKEMDALHLPKSASANLVRAKQNAALATMSRVKSRYFPNRPTIFEAVPLNEDQAWAFDFYDAVSTLGRIIVVPPGMPPPQLTFLQKAVKETLHNPELIAEGEKTDRIIEYLDPICTRKNAASVVSAVTPEQKERVLKILGRARGGKN